ncbi:hypothetical protein DGG96_19175 [Legionella qingyii]|uniref:Uncharacterized protein n=1 Tax=Legionella qingyii TaxID=2184757 RepID=A0A317TZZ5_9GAMM|nr:hypothetical protein [Legionella qingyii]PWY54026.1 hypothetical protein DGG96_19175 [Legionella qingyii]RUR19879.1 hypothetical protein ELY20_15275 [Legionella qingyii]RUR22351.1 hypothetical protein ELY16_14980 [Legionella qingyii]
MKLNIQNLLKELVSYTIVGSSNLSVEAKSILSEMRKEFKRLEASSDANKQKKMIALFMGGTISALIEDDLNYNYTFKLYPNAATKEILEEIPTNVSKIEGIYVIGNKALSNLPQLFNSDIFKVEEKIINTNNPIPFFPKLKENADQIDLLVKFCIKYSNDLEHSEVETDDLALVNLKFEKPASVEADIVTPFSNISMQILGGFMAVVGAAAVVVAFVVLNAATFGIAGLITAGIGIAAALSGVGLFATGTYRNCQSAPDQSLDSVFVPV